MVFLENPPTYARLEEEFAWEKTYEEERRRRYREEPVLSRVSGVLKWMRLNLKKPRVVKVGAAQLAALRHRFPDAARLRLLDLGCGHGDKGERTARLGSRRAGIAVEPVGIEVSKALAAESQERFAALGGHCIQKPATEGLADLDGGTVHLIILSSFLEHEVNPVQLLQACHRVLAPGGRIIIKVPNYGCLNRRVRQERWCGFRYPDHVNYFTPETLRATIEVADLVMLPPTWRDMLPTSDNMWAVAARE